MSEPVTSSEDLSIPRVAAILVVHNQASALRRALGALERSQNRERLEILVVDCGSGDESPQLDAEYPAINMLRLPHHFGATKARNIAMRTAKAELILFLSPDVEVAPDTVFRLADRLEEDSSAVAACPLLVNPEGTPVEQIFQVPTKDDFAAGTLRAQTLDPSADEIAVSYAGSDALLVRKAFLRGVNYFDERFGHYWGDLDLATQIHRAGKKIRVYPGIRATRHAAADPLEGDPIAQADKLTGAAEFLGKYQGAFDGFLFRLGAAFKALFSGGIKKFSLLIGGQKLDGTQAG
jgi:GT2 family glycosyltransferase